MKDQLESLIAQMHTSGILYSEATREFKKRFILMILIETKGNQCKAAAILGMHRNTLNRTIRELKLDTKGVITVRKVRPAYSYNRKTQFAKKPESYRQFLRIAESYRSE